jgi:pimeloyl-ACP methyl ester carboxylesterase
MVATIPNCRLTELPLSGHGVPRDNPAAFLAAVRPFLLEA